jgi:DNA-binding MarR family transcriptional regulator
LKIVYLFLSSESGVMTKNHLDVAIGELIHAVSLLVRRVRAAAGPQELSLSAAALLKRLEQDGPVTISGLARAESMTSQSMGTIVAALEEDGLVKRRPHPTDGRQFFIKLTEKGKMLRESRISAKRAWMAKAIAKLDKDEQDVLFEAAKILKRLATKK